MRDQLNVFLSDWGLPVFIMIMVLGTITGIVMNFKKINSTNFEEKKEGLFAVLYILLYVFIGVAVIGGVLAAISGMDLSI